MRHKNDYLRNIVYFQISIEESFSICGRMGKKKNIGKKWGDLRIVYPFADYWKIFFPLFPQHDSLSIYSRHEQHLPADKITF